MGEITMTIGTHFDETVPQTSVQWINKGHRLKQEERYTDAVAAYQQAILCDSQNASAYKYLAHAWYELGQYDLALAGYQRALELNPDSLPLLIYKGEILE